MVRLCIALALWFFGTSAALAQPPRANNACAGSVVLTQFVAPLYCLNGVRYANYDQIPGWGSASEAGAGYGSYAPDAQGVFHSFGFYSLRITNLGLLVEQGSTNYALYSNVVGGTGWSTTAASYTATGQPDLFGTNGAGICTGDGTLSLHQCYNMGPVIYAANTVYVESFFVKPIGSNPATYVQVKAPSASGVVACANFNISNGIPGSETSTLNSGIVPYANGWFQVYISFQTSSSPSTGSAAAIALVSSYTDPCAPTNTSSSSILISQAQLQLSLYPTSPIITQASAVIALPVFAYIKGVKNIGSGTLYSKTYSLNINFNLPPYAVSIDNYLGSNLDQIALIQGYVGGFAKFNIQNSSYTNTQTLQSSFVIDKPSRLSVSWSNQYFGSGNGNSPVQGSLSSYPTSTITEIEFGEFSQNNYYLNGYVQSAEFLQKPLSGSALQNLTLQGP